MEEPRDAEPRGTRFNGACSELRINFLFLGLLIRSGWEILASHPRLYWRNDYGLGTEWLKFTKDEVSHEVGEFTARDDQRNLHPLISLPGRAKIGLGRAWHGVVTTLRVPNGLNYVVVLFGTGSGDGSSRPRGTSFLRHGPR